MDKNQTKYCMPRVRGSQLSCTLVGVLGVLFNLRNTAVLIHGPAGCAHYGMKFCQQMTLRETKILPGFHPMPLNFRTTALSEKELIFGGEDLLCEKIDEMLKAFPDYPLFVVPCCTVEVIGDDVEGVCERMSQETGRTVIAFSMGGFLKGDHYQGINSAYFDLIRNFLTPTQETDSRMVNVVAERSLAPTVDIDFLEIQRLLRLLGLGVNTRFVRSMAFEDLPKVTRAGLNLPAVRNQSVAICEHLRDTFDMPFLQEGFPSGFKDTRLWLESIAENLALDADIDALVESERAFVTDEIRRLDNTLKGLKIVVNTFPMHMGWLTEFLDLVGAELLEVNILDTAYFEADFLDRSGPFPCPVNKHMSLEDILANNRSVQADLYLQCSLHYSPIPNHQPGLLIKEVPVIPPVGPRGMLNLFVNWSQWVRSTQLEGWRRESIS